MMLPSVTAREMESGCRAVWWAGDREAQGGWWLSGLLVTAEMGYGMD